MKWYLEVLRKLLAVSAIACATSTSLAAEQRARTEDGKEVILRDNETWIYAPPRYQKDPRAVQQYKGRHGTFALWLVPETWRQLEKPSNKAAEVEFTNKDGDEWGMVIAERVAIPLETLRKGAIDNFRKVDPDVAIVEEEKRVVNGTEVLSLVMNVKSEGVAVTMYGYYYVGKEGSIQVVTGTGQNLFQESRPEFEAFLNGFEVIEGEKSR